MLIVVMEVIDGQIVPSKNTRLYKTWDGPESNCSGFGHYAGCKLEVKIINKNCRLFTFQKVETAEVVKQFWLVNVLAFAKDTVNAALKEQPA